MKPPLLPAVPGLPPFGGTAATLGAGRADSVGGAAGSSDSGWSRVGARCAGGGGDAVVVVAVRVFGAVRVLGSVRDGSSPNGRPLLSLPSGRIGTVRIGFGWSNDAFGGDVVPVVVGEDCTGDGNTTRGTAAVPGGCSATGCSSRETSRSSLPCPPMRSCDRDFGSAGTILFGELSAMMTGACVEPETGAVGPVAISTGGAKHGAADQDNGGNEARAAAAPRRIVIAIVVMRAHAAAVTLVGGISAATRRGIYRLVRIVGRRGIGPVRGGRPRMDRRSAPPAAALPSGRDRGLGADRCRIAGRGRTPPRRASRNSDAGHACANRPGTGRRTRAPLRAVLRPAAACAQVRGTDRSDQSGVLARPEGRSRQAHPAHRPGSHYADKDRSSDMIATYCRPPYSSVSGYWRHPDRGPRHKGHRRPHIPRPTSSEINASLSEPQRPATPVRTRERSPPLVQAQDAPWSLVDHSG